ncbi:MAG: hypothetical protein AUJ52_09315 [Elusimicrobia bacterium CG1_02_63_36]|nr:MAG: hypothetical protein AUJ52_09315 [Elusimicrobia bacterium CG1_02_63_36]PIP82921.1 MAG: hypothetical protein COR54_12250 [Elusimicrobia bacterium CG22_combo_CG10-13_8_21_14_all_63_91]
MNLLLLLLLPILHITASAALLPDFREAPKVAYPEQYSVKPGEAPEESPWRLFRDDIVEFGVPKSFWISRATNSSDGTHNWDVSYFTDHMVLFLDYRMTLRELPFMETVKSDTADWYSVYLEQDGETKRTKAHAFRTDHGDCVVFDKVLIKTPYIEEEPDLFKDELEAEISPRAICRYPKRRIFRFELGPQGVFTRYDLTPIPLGTELFRASYRRNVWIFRNIVSTMNPVE